MKTKIKEQENSKCEMGSAIERCLKIQPFVKKLQGNISKISKHGVPRANSMSLIVRIWTQDTTVGAWVVCAVMLHEQPAIGPDL